MKGASAPIGLKSLLRRAFTACAGRARRCPSRDDFQAGRRSKLPVVLLAVILGLASMVALGVGSHLGTLTFDLTWLTQPGQMSPLAQDLFWGWRAPRVLASLIVGAALAIAGLVLQGVTRNPLADPFLLGISGGAGLAVVVMRAFLPGGSEAPWLTPLVAFAGAILAMAVVAAFAREGGGRLTTLGLILVGIVVNAFCAALITFITSRFDPFRLRVTATWLIGGISYSGWLEIVLVGGLAVCCWLGLRTQAHRLNAFALGEEGARFVGVDTQRTLWRAATLASLLAGLSVSLAGLLGYVGLIAPHAVRLALGQDFRRVLAATALAGALLTVLADTAARTLFAPEELPAGVFTALIGCPVLLVLVRGQLRGRQ